MPTTDNIVIAFVPGTSASELNLPDNAKRAWPDALELIHIARDDARCRAVADQTALPVGDIVDHFRIGPDNLKCYGQLIRFMQDQMGFTSAISSSCTPLKSHTKPLAAPLPKVFYHCPYDWRQDNRTSAKRLGAALTELDSVYTNAGQTYRLYIVGHSMGGLVSRGLLEDPASKSAPWFGKARALITLATPHYGAPLALSAMLGQQIAKVELMAYVNYVQSVVDKPIFPSTYELLPPPGHPFIQDDNGATLDVYTAESAAPFMKALAHFNFNPESLEEAKTFFSTLTVTSPDNTPIPYHCFVGTERPTLASDAAAHQPAFTYRPDPARPQDDPFQSSPKVPAGDGIVPTDSARFVFPLDDARCRIFPNYSHGEMGGSNMKKAPDAIRAMLEVIGLALPPRGTGDESEDDVRDEPNAS
ncbi:lipase family alpha/beta hydrolase [Burkholderia plantarii]|uniref:lipase family alpha/beta hydrolase n=1 Tax=Burkholderia plantarii TaxID=41899 RepID=UPI0018DDDBC6|nr:hypothetical protein [Burkholderia plantarii]MBI0329279.1 hypothetical protein [Burkholderia plantarii]